MATLSALILSTIVSMPGGAARATNTSAERTSASDNGELKLVVALFRHGVRSPTPDFAPADADQSSGNKWPSLTDWQVMRPDCDGTPPPEKGWGYLTKHGFGLAQALGTFYGNYYKQGAWSNGFNIYLWADALNQRTRATAKALAAGFKNADPGLKITTDSLTECSVDPLFHPFQRNCGTPDGDKLVAFATGVNKDSPGWVGTTYASELAELYPVLNCQTGKCPKPLPAVKNHATSCTAYANNCKSPLQWKAQFSYASSASEAFLLEYANGMNVGWGNVNPPNVTASAKIPDMLKLHELYFDKTDRFVDENNRTDLYLASIEGSNLIREILDQMNRKAGLPTDGKCPRANAQSDFVGLIGHDTNLATVGALLGLNWRFDDKALPADTRGLPANDALPAGALVFELRRRSDASYSVRVEYVTQSLSQMRKGPTPNAFRLAVDGAACVRTRPCEMPFEDFRQLIKGRLRPEFLSTCDDHVPPRQVCGPPIWPRPQKTKGRRPH